MGLKLEDQVCSLELAKRLKGLGVNQDSWFYWCITAPILTSSGTDYAPQWRELHLLDKYTRKKFDYIDSYSAFTVAELGEMLPAANPSSRAKDETGWYMNVINPLEKWHEMFPCNTEADARAKMLIYLIENDLIGST
jgi:hypothetical protein